MKIFILICSIAISLIGGEYKIPPSSSAYGYVPVISDEMMKKCIEVYNQAQWLENSLNSFRVDQYSSLEVKEYNRLLYKYNSLINWFNFNCAGKQSKSACEVTKKLNKQNGLPYQDCN
ncbi:hypothetical protein [Campylobacter sp. RM16190]|uniref:hypothetical protein n=1 Tax=Campylobacter sp. RM16190 TaxID=1705727 RepID=UPI00147293B6|nr:hypothetical protein [Campylobacter sp. RM16190]